MFSFLSLLSFACVICVSGGLKEYFAFHNNTDIYLNTEQIIRKYGYPSESHTVKTVDGYLLTMYRIPNGNYTKPPILFHHGVLGQSKNFMLLEKNSLPFLLADLGYDIWLANVRGNSVSRAHVNLFPDDTKFWNFTWHESGIYDLPAQIDFICNYTKQKKINFVGLSLGTTLFLVMTSTLPEYNQKIESAHLMAVIGYLGHQRSPSLNFLTKIDEKIRISVELFKSGEFLPDSVALQNFLKSVCLPLNALTKLCWDAFYSVFGIDPKLSDKYQLSLLLSSYPKGYSVKGLVHYSQLIKSGKFRQFDYGQKGNLLEYGTETPPEYNLSLITTPMYFYISKTDSLSTLTDVQILARELSTLQELHVIDSVYFNHIDFLLISTGSIKENTRNPGLYSKSYECICGKKILICGPNYVCIRTGPLYHNLRTFNLKKSSKYY